MLINLKGCKICMSILKLFEKQKEITRNDVEEALGVETTHAVNTLIEILSKILLKKWVEAELHGKFLDRICSRNLER